MLFYNLAGYDYFPEERVSVDEEDALKIAQGANLAPAERAGKVSAFDMLKAAQAPSTEPYWKLRHQGACQDIFFISNYQAIGGLIDTMYDAADKAGYPVPDLGIYIQPIVQGCNFHVEFNLFYDPDDPKEVKRVQELASGTVNTLISRGAFFSRPYGEITRTVMNKDAATVEALRRVKTILDPDNVMNPGKLCF